MHELTPLKEKACPTLPSAKVISVSVAVFPPAESLPSPSPDHNATRPGSCVPAMRVADTVSLRTESTGSSTFPKPVLTANPVFTNQTVSVSPLAVVSFAELLETHSTELMSFTPNFKSPSSAERNLKFFSTLVPITREPSRSSTVSRGGGFVSAGGDASKGAFWQRRTLSTAMAGK